MDRTIVKVTTLKELPLATPLAKAIIVAGDSSALKDAATKLAAKFGAAVVDAASVKLPLKKHVIAIGNRINNPFIKHVYL